MAFDLKGYYGYGTGAYQDFDVKAGQKFTDFNSYAKVTKIDRNLIELDLETATLGRFEKFTTGNDILIHASTSSGLNRKIGKVICAHIDIIDGNKVTLDKNIESMFENSDLLDYNIQAVTFANFHCLNILAGGEISPLPYDTTKLYGGILAIKCSYECNLVGGSINLEECGIPCYQKENLRPLTNQELSGELDSDPYAGQENLFDNDVFPLNSGDGEVFLIAKKFFANDNARIGNRLTHGKPKCRGAKDSSFKPSNITNIGGSSILIVTNDIDLKPVNLAKYRNEYSSLALKGKGLARCYVALPDFPKFTDDKLYHADIISNQFRVGQKNKIYDFGSGSYGTCIDPNYRLNRAELITGNYGKEIAVTYTKKFSITDFKIGARVLILKSFKDRDFFVAKILTVENFDGSRLLTLDTAVTHGFKHVIAMPEFENFTLTEQYDDLLVMYVSDKCKISAPVTNNAIIIANNLEFGEGAYFQEDSHLIVGSLTGFNNMQSAKEITIYKN